MTINQMFEETQTNVPSRVDLYARCVGNGAASPTGVKGVTGITWVSTGKYTITLPRKYAGLVGFNYVVINSAGTTLSSVFISADNVASAGTLTIEVFGGATTVAPTRRDLTSADTLIMDISVMDSAQKPAKF